MTTWSDVEAWRQCTQHIDTTVFGRGRVVFAEVRFEPDGRGFVDDRRFAATGSDVVALRPCYFVPGKWRVLERRPLAALRNEASLGHPDVQWHHARVRELLVALDLWLEAGRPKGKPRRLLAPGQRSP